MTVDPVAQVAKNWWLFLILGLVTVIAGILAIVYPGITLLALGHLRRDQPADDRRDGDRRGVRRESEARAMNAIIGVLSLLAGLVCLRRPGESLLAIIIVLGFWLIIEGVDPLHRAFAVLEDRALMMGLAILDIILGVLILAAARAEPRHARDPVRDLTARPRRLRDRHRVPSAGRSPRRDGRRRACVTQLGDRVEHAIEQRTELDEEELEHTPSWPVRRIVRMAFWLGLTGVSLYLVAPSLIEVFGSATRSTRSRPPGWP